MLLIIEVENSFWQLVILNDDQNPCFNHLDHIVTKPISGQE